MKTHTLAQVALLISILFYAGCGDVEEDADQNVVFESVILAAKEAVAPDKHNSGKAIVNGDDLIPESLSSEALMHLAKDLKQHDWDLDIYGDRGVTVIEQAFTGSLYRLAARKGGDRYLIELLVDEELSWDASHSLTLQDALVRCGRDALPGLKKVTVRKHLANSCIELINTGASTAF